MNYSNWFGGIELLGMSKEYTALSILCVGVITIGGYFLAHLVNRWHNSDGKS